MGVIKVDDIRDQVDELVSRMESGEVILVEKDGQTIARIEPVKRKDTEKPARPNEFDWEALKRFTDTLPMAEESSADLVRRMRDESY